MGGPLNEIVPEDSPVVLATLASAKRARFPFALVTAAGYGCFRRRKNCFSDVAGRVTLMFAALVM